jgi:Na+/H+ antiporter NhaD/arsenite permease-like protein
LTVRAPSLYGPGVEPTVDAGAGARTVGEMLPLWSVAPFALLLVAIAVLPLAAPSTCVGNGPNFVVKAIAEESGVRMPGVLGYMAWNGAMLLPVFAVVTWPFLP